MNKRASHIVIPAGPGLLMGLAVIIFFAGWHLFWFLTDDAFIAFRYISNRQMGLGYVWNGAPWLAVEGYTSFLWIVLLDAVWTVTGVEPPAAANVLSLLCSFGTVVLFALFAWNLAPAVRGRHLLFALALLGLVSHRVFLTWTSSGLETALFNFLFLAWVLAAHRFAQGERRNQWLLSFLAALISLARPDGYLFVIATLLIFFWWWRQSRVPMSTALMRLSPLVIVVAHILWRRWFYGEWLPNTYFAKSVGPLPDLGASFLAMFIIEHALWLWLLLVAAAVIRARVWRGALRHVPRLVAGGAAGLHVLFYVVVAGGDHFEYRVLSHLIPLLLLGLLWSVSRLWPRSSWSAIVMLAVLGVSSVLPWVQWKANLDYDSWIPEIIVFPIADKLPRVLGPYGRLYDRLEAENARHGVALRHQHHKVFCRHQLSWVPPRRQGAKMFEGEQNPVVLTTGAGVTGWSFPTAHVIDYYGLNDYVIARTPPLAENLRSMAHARRPPPSYVESFRPNLTVTPGRISSLKKRSEPLRDEDIIAIEAHFREALGTNHNAPH